MAQGDRRGDRERGKFRRGLTEALLEYARAHFALSRPDPQFKGKTRLQVLKDVQIQTGVVAPELAALPDLPVEAAYLWRWFHDLGIARTSGMALNPIAWSDMAGYFDLIRVRPERWEIEAIRAMDNAYLASRDDSKPQVAVTGAGGMKRVAPGEKPRRNRKD